MIKQNIWQRVVGNVQIDIPSPNISQVHFRQSWQGAFHCCLCGWAMPRMQQPLLRMPTHPHAMYASIVTIRPQNVQGDKSSEREVIFLICRIFGLFIACQLWRSHSNTYYKYVFSRRCDNLQSTGEDIGLWNGRKLKVGWKWSVVSSGTHEYWISLCRKKIILGCMQLTGLSTLFL